MYAAHPKFDHKYTGESDKLNAYSHTLRRQYKSTPYIDLGTLAHKATDPPSKPGFASSGSRPSAITNLLLSKWTDQENKRCVNLLSKSQAFQDARDSLKSTRRGVWATSAASEKSRPQATNHKGRLSLAASKHSSRPTSAQTSTRSRSSYQLESHPCSARSSRPQSASDRSNHSCRLQGETFAASGPRISGKVFAYDRTFVDPSHELRESVKLKAKNRSRRYGLVRPSSATIGSHVNTRPPVRPQLGKSHEMRSFMTTIALN